MAREVAGFIASEVDRANSLITRFLQFARPLQLRLRDRRPGQTLDRAVALVEREAPAHRHLQELRARDSAVSLRRRAAGARLLQPGAERRAGHPPGGAVTREDARGGGTAEIAVIDRGAGIDPKQLDSIFNPFFTTKPEGVGLGLAIVSKIVDEHGGKIAVESEPGKGSIFRVLLPMERRRGRRRSRHRMKKRILVVEDEDKLRRVIELQLALRRVSTWTRPAPPRRGSRSWTAPTWCSPISSCPTWTACSFWG